MQSSTNPVPSTVADAEAFIEKIPEVPNKAIQGVMPTDAIPDLDYCKPAENFWKYRENGTYLPPYSAGKIAGTYNSRRASLNEIFAMYMSTLKYAIDKIAIEEDKETGEFEQYFKNLQLAQTLLDDKLKKFFDNNVDGMDAVSYIHGMLNNFIEKRINDN